MGQNEIELQTQDDGEDEPDWEMMSVLPMTQCSTKKYNSNIWDYFGQLMRGTVCVDNRNYYCLLCFQDHKFKQYSASTATSNFYVHLRTIHDLIIDRRITNKSTTPKQKNVSIKTEPTLDDTPNKNAENDTEIASEIYNSEEIDIIANDDEYIDQDTTTETANYDENLFIEIPKRNTTSRRYRSKPYSTSINTSLPLQIEESVNCEDYDQLFILSLIKEFRRIPDVNRLECKSEIISVLKKYQSLNLSTEEEYFSIEPAGAQSYTIITEIESAANLEDHDSTIDPELVGFTFEEEDVSD